MTSLYPRPEPVPFLFPNPDDGEEGVPGEKILIKAPSKVNANGDPETGIVDGLIVNLIWWAIKRWLLPDDKKDDKK